MNAPTYEIPNPAEHPYRLRKATLDQAATAHFGAHLSKTDVAARLGFDKTSLSLFRNGHRHPSYRFVITVLTTFPNATFDQFFEVTR